MLVRDAMSGPAATCRSDDSALDALRIMRDRRIRHLPVVGSGGTLEGVLSLTDIILKAEENGSPALLRDVSAAIREILQKRGNNRVLEQNPFYED